MRDTIADLTRERNALKQKLWDDNVFAHRWLCHPDGKPCEDGCDAQAKPSRLALYQSELEDS